jgi:hypothetical protein
MNLNRGQQRRKIDNNEQYYLNGGTITNESSLTKEDYRRIKIYSLKSKYFNKIVASVNKSILNNKTEVHFYYNYYDFINKSLGKPHGFVNEFMYEMSYEYSEFVKNNDSNGNNIVTFKTLFGNNFRWQLIGKNMIKINW